jgi:hypothetical protein
MRSYLLDKRSDAAEIDGQLLQYSLYAPHGYLAKCGAVQHPHFGLIGPCQGQREKSVMLQKLVYVHFWAPPMAIGRAGRAT